MRRVLVTGGAGFIGATLVRRLRSAGFEVRVLDDGRAAGFGALDGTSTELVAADVLTADLAAVVGDVDAIVHLAAQTSIQVSIADPIADLRQNVEGTVRLLEAARVAGVPRFVLSSSAAVLGLVEPPAHEGALPRPAVPYGAAKLAAEAYLHAYFATHGMVTTSIRFANVYGPFALHKHSVVPRFVRAAIAGEPLTIYGDGSQTRDFVHVDDLATLLLSVLEADPTVVGGRVFHGASGIETTIRELADRIAESGPPGARVQHLPARVGDVARSRADIGLASTVLGYRPHVGLAQGIASTVDWFRTAAEAAGTARG